MQSTVLQALHGALSNSIIIDKVGIVLTKRMFESLLC